MGHADAHKCDACKGEKAHAIVPLYVPPKNPELYAALRGRRVEIITGSKPQV